VVSACTGFAAVAATDDDGDGADSTDIRAG